MDLKGQIVDTKINIKPSLNLLEYLKTLPSKPNFPENINKIITGKKEGKKRERIQKKLIVDLSKEELEFINRLKTSSSDEKSDENKENIETVQNCNKNSENGSAHDKESIKEPESENSQADKENEGATSENTFLLQLEDIEWLYSHLTEARCGDKDVPYLHELLQDCEILTPENAVLKRNPELEARCVKLRAQQETREYRAMTKSVDNVRIRFPEDSIAYQLKQLNRQLIAVGQFLLSIFAGFLFGFKGVELMIGGLDFGFRLLLGVMCALVIALAEIYFLAKKLNEELTLPEMTQIGGPPVYANVPGLTKPEPIKKDVKEHID